MSDDRLRAVLWRPLVVAPMGGESTTVAPVAAATEAGALGFLAAAYKQSTR